MRKVVIIGIFLWAGTGIIPAEPLRIVSYNVENLFHPAHDSVAGEPKDDWEWTPEGERRWTYARYGRKVENIARVLTDIGEWDGVDIAGLQEVENARCLRNLCYTLRRGEYDFVHYESPDTRGIDVALIYKKARIDTIRTENITPTLSCGEGELVTRDILYVCALADKKDTLHLFVCHLPSQRGGTAESEWKRTAVKEVLQRGIDSVYTLHPDAKIIVMGDFNGAPKEDLRGVRNLMKGLSDQVSGTAGTHKYQGRWSCLDQFYTSPAIDSLCTVRIYNAEWIMETDEKHLGLKPMRTYNGFRYQNGFSDHLPIVLEAQLR